MANLAPFQVDRTPPSIVDGETVLQSTCSETVAGSTNAEVDSTLSQLQSPTYSTGTKRVSEQQARELVAEHAIPDIAVTDRFVRQLTMVDDRERLELIRERQLLAPGFKSDRW